MISMSILTYRQILVTVLSALFYFSCDDEATLDEKREFRYTTCTKTADYAYLDNYVRGTPCTDSLCNAYQNIWKQIFIESNGLTNDYFNKHIVLYGSEINDWNDGASFSICYEVKIDWAIAYNCDQFIVKITADEKYYPSLELPRNTYLTKEKVRIAVENGAFSSDITKLLNAETLKFNSMDSAVNYLVRKANVSTLCSGGIYINNLTGGLVLESFAQYDGSNNECISATADLVHGEASILDTPCFID